MHDYFRAMIKNVFNYIDEGVYFVDSNKNIIYWNRGCEKLSGYRLEEAINQKCCQIISHINLSGEKICGEQCPVTLALQESQQPETEVFILHREGHRVSVTVRTFPVYDADNNIIGVIELISDSSQRKLGGDKVKALTKAAYIDSLTELVSKQYLQSRLQKMLNEASAANEPFGILYINILGFRKVNELYGVANADKILKMVAKTLEAVIKNPNIVGRWHGASFIAVVESSNKSRLLMLAEKVKLLVSESGVSIDSETLHVAVAVGTASMQSYDTIDYIIERATKAALSVSKEPDNNCALSSPVNTTLTSKVSERRHSLRRR
ncbi:sensor domain-containing diguanylate cyclase [Dendrosporobacter sp. 1207_IL3150]|uniref:sensor domain-containing diguanylate cyclase n=1 Tax=Dendrosporobacter sp. 1207_IL3150 TaxID=3084054 RepID=UPI002FD9A884